MFKRVRVHFWGMRPLPFFVWLFLALLWVPALNAEDKKPPTKSPSANWYAPRHHEGFDQSLRPHRSSMRRTLYKDGHLQVRSALLPCQGDQWCAAPAQCFDGIYRVACRCDSRSLDQWEDHTTRAQAASLVASLADTNPSEQETLIGTAAEATRRLFSYCPLKRFNEMSLLMDGRFAGTVKVLEPVPLISPSEEGSPTLGLWFRLAITPHPKWAEKIEAAKAAKQYERFRIDNISTGVDRHLVELSEAEMVALEGEILRATEAYDPDPTNMDIPLEDQRRLCQVIAVKEKIDSKAWTLLAKLAYGKNCENPTAGMLAVLKQEAKGLVVLQTVPAEETGNFALVRLAEVVDLKGDGRVDVLIGPVNPLSLIQEGQGAFINTAPSQWKFEQWYSGEDQ